MTHASAREKDGAAVVTGASSGIGAEIAREFVRRGHQVVLVARRADRAGRAGRVARHGRRTCCPPTFRRAADRAALLGRVAELGLIADILVNNAGLAQLGPIAESDLDAEINLVEVDVAAVVDLCSRFVPGMVERGRGAVLNVASVGAFGPLPGQAAYGAAKAFVLSYTQSSRRRAEGHRRHRGDTVPRSGGHRLRRGRRHFRRGSRGRAAEAACGRRRPRSRGCGRRAGGGQGGHRPGRVNRVGAACSTGWRRAGCWCRCWPAATRPEEALVPAR